MAVIFIIVRSQCNNISNNINGNNYCESYYDNLQGKRREHNIFMF